jgi:hypothetical protein
VLRDERGLYDNGEGTGNEWRTTVSRREGGKERW